MADLGPEGVERNELERMNDDIGTEVDQAEANASSGRRIAAALNLFLAGANYLEVANALDYSSPEAARMAIERAMAESVPEGADKEAGRRKMGMQYDLLIKSIASKAIDKKRDDQLGYVNTMVTILGRKAALFGYNAPTHIRVDPTGDDLDQMLTAVLTVADALPSPEGDPWAEDIVDADVVEDDDAAGQ